LLCGLWLFTTCGLAYGLVESELLDGLKRRLDAHHGATGCDLLSSLLSCYFCSGAWAGLAAYALIFLAPGLGAVGQTVGLCVAVWAAGAPVAGIYDAAARILTRRAHGQEE
jgi:hypothetical protein